MLCSWYEGSELLDHEFEWKQSAKISNYFTEVNEKSDINQLDFFIYAIKFRPLFPVLMSISFYILSLYIINWISKGKNFHLIHLIYGLILSVFGFIFNQGSTVGSYYFGVMFYILGITSLITAYLFYKKYNSEEP